MSRPFDEEDEELDDSFNDGLAAADGSTLLPPGEEATDDEVWDDADFDEEFDEDFDDEPDEDLEQFERELNSENIQSEKEPDEFDEEDF